MFDPVELRLTGNRYADQYVAAAAWLGLKTEIISPATGTVLISGMGRRLTVRAAIVGCNGMVAARFSSNKFLTSARLRKAGFRVPDFELFCTGDYPGAHALLRAVARFAGSRFPVVVKPVRGHGGAHVYAGIEDMDELSWAVETIWRASPGDIMVERHIHGQHYRIKVLDGEITHLVARYPGFVVGDGHSSVRGLIEEKNGARRDRHIPEIVVTERMTRLLARAGRTLDSVLPVGERQQLCIESNQHLGGECATIPVDKVPTRTADYLARAARATGLRWLGLDYIVDDIGNPLSFKTGYINEINSAIVPNEYKPGATLESYLYHATLVLKKYFDIPEGPAARAG